MVTGSEKGFSFKQIRENKDSIGSMTVWIARRLFIYFFIINY